MLVEEHLFVNELGVRKELFARFPPSAPSNLQGVMRPFLPIWDEKPPTFFLSFVSLTHTSGSMHVVTQGIAFMDSLSYLHLINLLQLHPRSLKASSVAPSGTDIVNLKSIQGERLQLVARKGRTRTEHIRARFEIPYSRRNVPKAHYQDDK